MQENQRHAAFARDASTANPVRAILPMRLCIDRVEIQEGVEENSWPSFIPGPAERLPRCRAATHRKA